MNKKIPILMLLVVNAHKSQQHQTTKMTRALYFIPMDRFGGFLYLVFHNKNYVLKFVWPRTKVRGNIGHKRKLTWKIPLQISTMNVTLQSSIFKTHFPSEADRNSYSTYLLFYWKIYLWYASSRYYSVDSILFIPISIYSIVLFSCRWNK